MNLHTSTTPSKKPAGTGCNYDCIPRTRYCLKSFDQDYSVQMPIWKCSLLEVFIVLPIIMTAPMQFDNTYTLLKLFYSQACKNKVVPMQIISESEN